MHNDPFDFIKEKLISESLDCIPDHVKDFLDPKRFSRKIEAEWIPDGMVKLFDILSPISEQPENPLNSLFEPIRSTGEPSDIRRYKKQLIVLEREITAIEKKRQSDKPLIQLAENTIAKNNKRIRSLRESCIKYSKEDKKEWEKEAEHIMQTNPRNNSASMLARKIIFNLDFPVEAYESIKKHLLIKGIKAHEKKKSKSVK